MNSKLMQIVDRLFTQVLFEMTTNDSNIPWNERKIKIQHSIQIVIDNQQQEP